jgi:Tfp pilus assembly protein PilX
MLLVVQMRAEEVERQIRNAQSKSTEAAAKETSARRALGDVEADLGSRRQDLAEVNAALSAAHARQAVVEEERDVMVGQGRQLQRISAELAARQRGLQEVESQLKQREEQVCASVVPNANGD